MIFLGLGANIGDKKENIERALNLLTKNEIRVLRTSSFYSTPPWGIKEQDEFINIVCEVAFEGGAEELLGNCLQVEQEMGRERIVKWGPRLIDIDILEFQRLQINTQRLTLPHPLYTDRDFVLVPFAELEPQWIPTGKEKDIQFYLKEIDISKCIRLEDKPSIATLHKSQQ